MHVDAKVAVNHLIVDLEPERAAEYVRMSTEHQRYSIDNQTEVIREFAARNQMAVVRTYMDYGKSGLQLHGRTGLQTLLDDVQSKRAGYSVVLVFDISRWGRFQDTDEGAYYEQLCKRAGVRVIYCAEAFQDDGSALATLAKGMHRYMAADYSRKLSAKVFRGQCRLIELGFRMGGPPGFGLRRMLVDATGHPKVILNQGDRKSLQSDRVILVPGPREEVEVVWRIYDMYLADQMSEVAIARRLNEEVPRTVGAPKWGRRAIHDILTTAKYAGHNEFHKSSGNLAAPRRKVSREKWVVRKGAFAGLVSPGLFDLVQEERKRRANPYSTEDLKRMLTALLRKKGELSAILINNERGMPMAAKYWTHFGGLREAYAAIGYCSLRNLNHLDAHRVSEKLLSQTVRDILADFEQLGTPIVWNEKRSLFIVGEAKTLTLKLVRCVKPKDRGYRWPIRLRARLSGDQILLLRLETNNQCVTDYFLVPKERLDEVPCFLGRYLPRMDAFKLSGLPEVLERLRAVSWNKEPAIV